MNSIIITAAGQGCRFGASQNKLLEKFGSKPLIWYTLQQVKQSTLLDEMVIVTNPAERQTFIRIAEEIGINISVRFADGGPLRFDSVAHGLDAVSTLSEVVLVHDGARPLVDGRAMDLLIEEIKSGTPAAIFAIPCTDTIKVIKGEFVIRTLDRNRLWRAQTPQGIKTAVFRQCIKTVQERQITVTDDASICEMCGVPVKCLKGKESYFKVTLPEDKERLCHVLGRDLPVFRIGQGYDIHQISPERPLVLGGVRIAESGGLAGHSDADVLIHAIMDALLGAAGCRDIGYYFPDNDETFHNIASVLLLQQVRDLVEEKGYFISNIDGTVIAEAPKIAPYIEKMRIVLSDALKVLPEQIGIKATTNESLGAVGRKEGMAALASALLYKRR